MQIQLGQSMDILMGIGGEAQMEKFDMAKYVWIVTYKTSFYSFYLPVALALHYTGFATSKNLAQTKEILIEMGEYFQAQDDYLDCFGDPLITGKIGTDIQDCKCSWLINQALQRATPEQHKVLKDSYGRHDPILVDTVKNIYREIDVESVFSEYEAQKVKSIRAQIEELDESEGLKSGIFQKLLDKIYRREK
ncbi:hypothetical protein PRZ48_005348 [Zasmidium cellare]|uniref:Farnesyl pyrophosphate synthase n=1 Tax=Zasmidium cellare TaxID=395010 RepID=A0ABR0ESD7_ZASCE|nr:hypothetical protein PRZ48_005348 [Zasmidium cellare]